MWASEQEGPNDGSKAGGPSPLSKTQMLRRYLNRDNWRFHGKLQQTLVKSLFDRGVEPDLIRRSGYTRAVSSASLSMDGTAWGTVEYKLSGYFSKDKYNQDEQLAEVGESYIHKPLYSRFWLGLGRQVLPWGQSRYYQLMDTANPRDQREYDLSPVKGRRLPMASTKLTWLNGPWGTDFLFLHEFRADRIAPEFDVHRSYRESLVDEVLPRIRLSSPDYLVRAFFSTEGGGISLIAGQLHQSQSFISRSLSDFELRESYARIKMAGGAIHIRANGFRLFAEGAYKEDVPIQGRDLHANTAYRLKPKAQAAGGLDYSSYRGFSLAMEGYAERVLHYTQDLQPFRTRVSSILSIKQLFWNYKAHIGITWQHWMQEQFDGLRIGLEYSYIDFVTFALDYVEFVADKKGTLLAQFDQSDYVRASIRMRF